MLVFVFVLTLAARAVPVAVVAKVIAYGATNGTTQPGTNGRTGGTAQLTADKRAASTTDSATDGGFGFTASGRTHCTACGGADTCADGCSRRTAQLLTDNIA